MKTGRWNDLKKKSKLSPERLAAIEAESEAELLAELEELNLRAVRELAGKTQAEAAKILETSQGELSRFERREDHLISRVRKLVEGLGGELDVIARFGDKMVRLKV